MSPVISRDGLVAHLRASFSRGELVDLGTPEGPGDVAAAMLREILGASEKDLEAGACLRLRHARITGNLDLARLTIGVPLDFDACDFDGPVRLHDARLDAVRFHGGTLRGIDAQNVRVERDVVVDQGASSTAPIDLTDAEIGGHLVLTGSMITVDRRLIAVKLGRARIGRRVSLAKTVITGKVRLVATRIGGTLSLQDACLDAGRGVAFLGERLEVDESIFMEDAVVYGLFSLLNARVGGGVDATRVQVHRSGKTALSARRVSIGRNFAGKEASVRGDVRFDSARIGGTMSFEQASFPDIPTALWCRHLRAGLVRLTFARPPTRLDLRHADVDVVEDKPSSWPRRIELEHCSYRTLISAEAVPAKTRLDWLDRSSDRTYQPSTYAALIAVYESVGDDKSMRRVTLAGQRKRRTSLPLTGRAAGYFLDATVGYGYRNGRALIWLAALLLVGAICFTVVPALPSSASAASGTVPFNPWFFTLDQIVPVIDLGQRKNWAASGWTQSVSWGLVLAGWALTTALVAGFSRFLGKK